jgi:dTDP-4-dehydrorhamnose reductase
MRELRPQLIVNAAAYTAVEQAETEEAVAARINAAAPRVIAEEAERLGAWLVHYSTDYVFDGAKLGAYLEDDAPNPVNAYGRTKLAGEEAIASIGGKHLIFRTSWVYASRRANFLRTIQRLAHERDELRIVDDQRGAPTWARIVAESTTLCVAQVLRGSGPGEPPPGIYHLTCGGETSWFGFAQEIFESMGDRGPALIPIASGAHPARARRPANSMLDNAKVAREFGIAPVEWRHALELCLDVPCTGDRCLSQC